MAIRVDYMKTLAQSHRLHHIASEHRGAARQLDAANANLSPAWADMAGAAYLGVSSQLATDMRRTADEIDAVADAMAHAAKLLQEQQDRTAKAARGLQN